MTDLPPRYYFTYDAYKCLARPLAQYVENRPGDKELLVAFRVSDFEKLVHKKFAELKK